METMCGCKPGVSFCPRHGAEAWREYAETMGRSAIYMAGAKEYVRRLRDQQWTTTESESDKPCDNPARKPLK